MNLNQEEFEILIKTIHYNYCGYNNLCSKIDLLINLARTSVIRDYIWFTNVDNDDSYQYNLYNTFFIALRRCWEEIPTKNSSLIIKKKNNLYNNELLPINENEIINLTSNSNQIISNDDDDDIDFTLRRQHEKSLLILWSYLIRFPEFNHIIAAESIINHNNDFILHFFNNFLNNYNENYKNMLHWLYNIKSDVRIAIRKCIGKNLFLLGKKRTIVNKISNVEKSNVLVEDINEKFISKSRIHISPLLQILSKIISGLTSLNSIHHDLLLNVLIPLHLPNDMVEWRDQVPVIFEYHEGLVDNILKLINKDHELLESNDNNKFNFCINTINSLIKLWPSGFNTNTPKEILLLNELEKILEIANNYEFDYTLHSVLTLLKSIIINDSNNFRSIQRSLQIFKNNKIIKLISENVANIRLAISILLPAIYKRGELSWNPSVNKFSALTIKKLRCLDEDIFKFYANKLVNVDNDDDDSTTINRSNKDCKINETSSTKRQRPPLPSSSTSFSSFNQQQQQQRLNSLPPNATSLLSSFHPTGSLPTTSFTRWTGSENGAPPPVTITGIAPWSIDNNKASNSINDRELKLKKILDNSNNNNNNNNSNNNEKGIVNIEKFIKLCIPNEDNDPVTNSWNMLHSNPIPVLLPNLKFHDLVFGNVLGSGAFSSVRYARQIVLDKSRSNWPEFAIKIISEHKIIEENYQIAVIREMAILQLLTHPSICRLISSFRYTSSAYLVLEYASNGDLHSLVIKKKVKLSILSIRFIICQVLAGLLSIHKLGFSFNDLKPENLLITHNGYIKIADFGAARPYTNHAIDVLANSKDLLSSLRNGDWKDLNNNDITNSNNTVFNINIHNFSDDNRIEGTPAYLPPEILLMNTRISTNNSSLNINKELNNNNTSTDSWALGCVTSFCLHNRPPFYGDNHEVVEQIFNSHIGLRNVKFDNAAVTKDNMLDIKPCEDFISLLLVIDPNKRKNLNELINDEFLSHGSNDIDLVVIDTLNSHLNHSLLIPYLNNDIDIDISNKDKQEDKQWNRRQLSKLWVPSADDLYSSLKSNNNNENNSFENEYLFDVIIENEIEKYSSFI